MKLLFGQCSRQGVCDFGSSSAQSCAHHVWSSIMKVPRMPNATTKEWIVQVMYGYCSERMRRMQSLFLEVMSPIGARMRTPAPSTSNDRYKDSRGHSTTAKRCYEFKTRWSFLWETLWSLKTMISRHFALYITGPPTPSQASPDRQSCLDLSISFVW